MEPIEFKYKGEVGAKPIIEYLKELQNNTINSVNNATEKLQQVTVDNQNKIFRINDKDVVVTDKEENV